MLVTVRSSLGPITGSGLPTPVGSEVVRGMKVELKKMQQLRPSTIQDCQMVVGVGQIGQLLLVT